MNEGSNINKSLLALNNCINILSDEKKKDMAFIPYRNSKLTRILKDSLNGNTPVVMAVCITSNSMYTEETLNCLKYAEKAMAIKSEVHSNYMRKLTLYDEALYKKKITELQKEVNFLKNLIRKELKDGNGNLNLLDKIALIGNDNDFMQLSDNDNKVIYDSFKGLNDNELNERLDNELADINQLRKQLISAKNILIHKDDANSGGTSENDDNAEILANVGEEVEGDGKTDDDI